MSRRSLWDPSERKFPFHDGAIPKTRPYQTHNRRDLRFSRPELGPFDAYVLDGSRYIRVEGKDSYALVDTTTGKITWITKLDKRRVQVQHNALDKQAANHRETSENR